jgi:hypothetical protein
MPPLNRRKTVSFSAGNNLAAEFINIDETLIAASLNTIPPLPKSRFPRVWFHSLMFQGWLSLYGIHG